MLLLSIHYGEKGMVPASEVLRSGGRAIDAIEAGMRRVEPDPEIELVGRGGLPNALCQSECDGAVMDGRTLRAGTVGGLKGFLHPFSVARAVMERLPHVMLVGEGANRFAREIGSEWVDDMVTPKAQSDYTEWKHSHFPQLTGEISDKTPLLPAFVVDQEVFGSRDTVVYLAIDSGGDLVVGTSTSGWPFKYPGRLGDSPVVGAGLYANNRYGACCCTHTGEMTIRANTASSVVHYMKRGATVEEACFEAISDLQELRGGAHGPVVIYACDRNGDHRVFASVPKTDPFYYCFWDETVSVPERRKPNYFELNRQDLTS
ncbi:MAG: N(4)-(beta-N-acetylglucosaminyl)-L-asparaginase [Bdellovibrionales bacterium]|nr:N(4)-(beta-N-acetylglucosaminyl)-L-asparaginase [Bdellovibrionales bacterium]